MILWRDTENYPFYHFDSDPRFPHFLRYVRWKSGVTFVRRCFRDRFEDGSLVLIVSVLAHCLLSTTWCSRNDSVY